MTVLVFSDVGEGDGFARARHSLEGPTDMHSQAQLFCNLSNGRAESH